MDDNKPPLYPLQKIKPYFNFKAQNSDTKLSDFWLPKKYSKLSLMSNEQSGQNMVLYSKNSTTNSSGMSVDENDNIILSNLINIDQVTLSDQFTRKRNIDDNQIIVSNHDKVGTPQTPLTLSTNNAMLELEQNDLIHPPKRRLTSNNTSPIKAQSNNPSMNNSANSNSSSDLTETINNQISMTQQNNINSNTNMNSMEYDDQHQQLPLPSPSASPIPSGIDQIDIEPIENQLIKLPNTSNELISLVDSLSNLLNNDNRNHLIFKLLQNTDRSTLSAISGLLNSNLKRDLIINFPTELSLKILKYLDDKSLCNASKVCKNWLNLIDSSEDLWKELSFKVNYIRSYEELEKEMSNVDELFDKWYKKTSFNQSRLNPYKALYRKRNTIHKRWMDPNFEPKRLSVQGHGSNVVTCLQYDDSKIISGADDKYMNIYDTSTGKLINVLSGHEGGVWALKYIGNTLVSGSTDRTVRIWNIKQARCTHVFRGHISTVRCLDIIEPTEIGKNDKGEPIIFPEEPLLVTGSRDHTLHVWKLPLADPNDESTCEPIDISELENPFFIKALKGHSSSVRAVAGHGNIIVSGSYDMTIRVWDLLDNGNCKFILSGHTDKIYSTVLDHKRNRCITGSMDSTVKIWDLNTSACLYTLDGHSSLVGLLDLSDEALVSAAADATLRVWDPDTGKSRFKLKGHHGAITCFQHDYYKVISGSERMLKLWDIKTGKFVRDLLSDVTGGIWQVKFDYRRCVAAVQRRLDDEREETFIEILDFGIPEDDDDSSVRISESSQTDEIMTEAT